MSQPIFTYYITTLQIFAIPLLGLICTILILDIDFGRQRSHGFEISGWVQKRINASAVGLGIFLDFIPQSRSWRRKIKHNSKQKLRLEKSG
jgi:hypothetical protein